MCVSRKQAPAGLLLWQGRGKPVLEMPWYIKASRGAALPGQAPQGETEMLRTSFPRVSITLPRVPFRGWKQGHRDTGSSGINSSVAPGDGAGEGRHGPAAAATNWGSPSSGTTLTTGSDCLWPQPPIIVPNTHVGQRGPRPPPTTLHRG